MHDPILNADDFQPLVTAATQFADELERAAVVVFGDGEIATQLQEVARRLTIDVRRLVERGGAPLPALAVVGRLGEGKTWLAQCFLTSRRETEAIRSRLLFGQDVEHRTTRLLWFGPQQPIGLRRDNEDYLAVSPEQMLNLGRPYVVGDTPGTSFAEDAARAPASIAFNSAALKILVLSTHGLRDDGLRRFVAAMNGATVLPVVRFRPAAPGDVDPTPEARIDVEKQAAEWRRVAPGVALLDPIYMPESRGRTDGEQELMRRRLQTALHPRITEDQALLRAVAKQLRERIAAARREAADVLEEFRRRVGIWASPLEDAGRTLPNEVLRELIGDETALRVGIRQQLRAEWLNAVPAICFPYRTLVGLLSLTSGAWDRLVLAGLGSLPSLVFTGIQTVRNIKGANEFADRLRTQATQRVERALVDRLHDVIPQMQRAVGTTFDKSKTSIAANGEPVLKVIGIEGLESEVQGLLRDCIRRQAASRVAAALFGIVGVAGFWGFFFGPITALYGGYFLAWRKAIYDPNAALGAFPTPTASMLFTGLVLSAAPAFFVAIFGISWASLGGRVRSALNDFRVEADKLVRRRHAAGDLRINLTDPQLRAVRFFLDLHR